MDEETSHVTLLPVTLTRAPQEYSCNVTFLKILNFQKYESERESTKTATFFLNIMEFPKTRV